MVRKVMPHHRGLCSFRGFPRNTPPNLYLLRRKGVARNDSPPGEMMTNYCHYTFAVGENLTSRCNYTLP
ncbi:hypothetical protein MTR_5g007340 [Medicago truncatula]|uniref:Uncharacterized protein n=1 Tax=Medicago truncatula TaxID=3880 RepID=G7K554_MEDTR|nr:hypothetical protein MTR_5g007340 [Medicago truncatula]